MTKNYGIKISRPGYDVFTAQPNQLAFSSAYKTLKVHTSGSGSLTDSSRTVTIAHNLGYVPLFMVHSTVDPLFQSIISSGDHLLTPVGFSAVETYTVGSDDLFAYADTTNLYIKAQSNFGKAFFTKGSQGDTDFMAWESSTAGYTAGLWSLGNSGGATWKAAHRFENVVIPQATTIYKATVNLYVALRTGSSNIPIKIYGIDEDNTASFNTGTAGTARTKTTAVVDNTSNISTGNGFSVEVTSLVQEIVDRAGWASGNYLGLIYDDNGAPVDNNYVNNSRPDLVSLEIIPNSTIANYKYTIFKNQLE